MKTFSYKLLMKHAAKSEHYVFKHVVVLTRGGSIVSIACNRKFTHAETRALNKVHQESRKGLVAWSFRINREGKFAMALPCENCMNTLIVNGIIKVNYTDANGVLRSLRLNKRMLTGNKVKRKFF